jgi:hypothetical protein
MATRFGGPTRVDWSAPGASAAAPDLVGFRIEEKLTDFPVWDGVVKESERLQRENAQGSV